MLAKYRVYNLSIAEAEWEKRKDKNNNKIIQKYSKIYMHQGQADIERDNVDNLRVINI